MEIFICRPDEAHWCSECCEGRNCENFEELEDGSWGCLTHATNTGICKEVNCLTEMQLNPIIAMSLIAELPEGEFFASMLTNKHSKNGQL